MNGRQAIIRTNADSIHWRLYAALGGDELTHWGRVTHICVSILTVTGPDNGLSPGRRQAIIWTNAGILLIMPPPLGAGGIMFSGCPSVRPSEAWNTLFWPVHGSVGPPDQP